MIEIRGLVKSYGPGQAIKALRGIDLKIAAGEFVVVLGPSGAGKSTMLRCINRLTEPTAGEVVIDGVSFAASGRRDLRALRRNAAMIFQHHNLVKRLSVLKNVLVGRMAGLSPLLTAMHVFPDADVQIAMHCLEQVNLAHKATARADALSGGEQQRVGIARALAQQPKIMLADEPVASLDPKTSRVVLTYLKRICKEEKIAVLCNLHQIDYALEFGERIVGLSGGEIVYDGPPQGVTQAVIRQIYPGLDDPNILGAGQRLAERLDLPGGGALAVAGGVMTVAGYRLVVTQPRGPLGWWILLPIVLATVAVLWWAAIGTKLSLADFIEGMPWVADFIGRMLPPNFAYMQNLIKPAVESIQIALWGTLFGVLLALPVTFFAARNLSPHPVVFHAMRQVLNVMRGINEIILALIFVAAVGLGPFAGVIAMAIHGAGMLGKFFAEAVEEIDQGPLDALSAAGVGTTQKIVFGVLPQVLPAWIGVVLYRFETNIRVSTVLGMVGAGGIGFELISSMKLFQYENTAACVIVILVLVLGADLLSSKLRAMIR